MEASGLSEPLAGAKIHGFQNVADLHIDKLLEEAATRWFRPNEVHAILSNYTLLKVQPQPVENPPSGAAVLYDRKVVRNFRKDGHNWKKKKDGKAVQEAHEKLKVGNEERVHVYYARGADDPNFYRRCYWLLDKELERVVLVHYRHSEANQDSPGALAMGSGYSTPLPGKNLNMSPLTPDSNSISQHSEVSGGGKVYDEFNSENINRTENKEFTLQEINTLDWEDLLESPTQEYSMPNQQGCLSSMVSQVDPANTMNVKNGTFTSVQGPYNQPSGTLTDYTGYSQPLMFGAQLTGPYDQDALGGLIDDPFTKPFPSENPVFNITDMCPDWAYCTDRTKVLVVGDFYDQFGHHQSNLYCSIGGTFVEAEFIKAGVFRVMVPPNTPGLADFYMSLDCETPISQVMTFTYRPDNRKPAKGIQNPKPEPEWEDLCLLTRLAHLVFSSDKISLISNKLPQKQLKEAVKFVNQTSPLFEKSWTSLIKQMNEGKANTKSLLEMMLRNMVQEWLLEKVSEGCKITPLDKKGQGVIHLCAMLDYVWAVLLFALSGLSLDFRDSAGWTALHWAAFYGRERMVASLLSAGANPSLVTDPTPDSPGGSTASDLAAKQGFDGLAAYLAEKGITAHFEAMSLHGNLHTDKSSISTSTSNPESNYFSNLSEQELCLKDSLAAYRNAADAATKIQEAFRERALKLKTEVVQMEKPENEAEFIIAALRIQNAYRNYNRKKAIIAAARIQSHFRTWRMRRNFLAMRREAIRIQAVFRGHQVRRQYRKIIWSVGVVEKAILRWRHKRRGLRGIQSAVVAVPMRIDTDPSSSIRDEVTGEEDFFTISRHQAEARLTRSVVRVQALFRSHKAQQEYRRMKITHEQAQMEFNDQHQDDWEI